ncbi:MAG: type IV pilus biogenesis/stability protein PilW [Oceanospirillum sp.]|nr:type IV pilus biogenesis/stability protein PilW [Oceanospirillum sp.]
MRQGFKVVGVASILLIAACVAQPEAPVRSQADIQSSVTAYTELGFAYLEQQNLERAKRAFIKALALDGRAPDSLHGMALVYQSEGETALAEDNFRQALSGDKPFSVARNNFAAFLYANGRYDEACQQLKITISDTLYFNRQLAFENLGLCERQRAQWQQSEQAFRRALDLNEHSARALLEMAEVKEIQNKPLEAWVYLQKHFKVAKTTERSLMLGINLAEILGKQAEFKRLSAELARLKQ